jgi:hypothetical protein|tara:strand:- start:1063 stop:1392 length:330 start_codon:yes stop_codon:yes gene_type:complete
VALPLNVFKTVNVVASTSATEIYTAPTGYTGVVLMAQAANIDSAAHDVTFSHKRVSTVTELTKSTPIPGNDALAMVTGRLVLEPGDKLVLSASDGTNVKVTVSILETLN